MICSRSLVTSVPAHGKRMSIFPRAFHCLRDHVFGGEILPASPLTARARSSPICWINSILAEAKVVAAPIPLEPPVIKAVFPINCEDIVLDCA